MPSASTVAAPKPLGQQPGGNLEARHGAGEEAAQQAELRIAEPELRLPDRQQHVDEIGVAVVQRVRAAGDAGGAALVAPVTVGAFGST